MKNMKIYQKLLKLMFINNYCTDFMFKEVVVCVTYLSSILSLIIFNFLLVCWNSCLQVLIMKFIHKFQQNEWYLENKKEIRNYERQYCRV